VLDEDEMLGRILRLADQLPAACAAASAEPAVVTLDSALPQRRVDLIEQRCTRLSRALS
jgi:hypothetical protein